MNDTFLDQPMKSVMKTYIAGEILHHLVRRQRNAVINHCVTIAAKILLVYPKLKTVYDLHIYWTSMAAILRASLFSYVK
jgi:hypothetical protein